MPLPSLPCASATLRRASRAVSRLYDEEMNDVEMRGTQFTLLQVLEKAGPISQGRLGELLALDSTTLTRSLRLVQKEGWVSSVPGEDRRERYYKLTAHGQKRLQVAKKRWREVQTKLRKHLDPGEWEVFYNLADRIAQAAIDARESM